MCTSVTEYNYVTCIVYQWSVTCSHGNVYTHHCFRSQQCLQYWYSVDVSPSIPPLLPGRVQRVINQIIHLEGGLVSLTDFGVQFYYPFTSSLILLTTHELQGDLGVKYPTGDQVQPPQCDREVHSAIYPINREDG